MNYYFMSDVIVTSLSHVMLSSAEFSCRRPWSD